MKRIIGLFIIIAILSGCNPPQEETKLSFDTAEDTESIETTAFSTASTETDTETKGTIFVHVCGAVVNPGVYELPAGSRAYEAVQLAGGVTEDAAGYMVNLAGVLQDEEKLYIPREGETVAIADKILSGDTGSEDAKININTAEKEDLMLLTGIGSTKAQAIIDYREGHGSFTSIEQIMEVSGIKEAAFEKIKDKIKI